MKTLERTRRFIGSNRGDVAALWHALNAEGSSYLAPIVAVLLVVSLLLALTAAAGPIAPFIYPLF